MSSEFGKILIFIGIALTLAGLVAVSHVQIPWLGRLPGDIVIKREGLSFYFPIVTSILVSVVLTILFSIFRR